MTDRDPTEHMEAIERFAAHPVWQELTDHLSARGESLMAKLAHENTPDDKRSTYAAAWRELKSVMAWPADRISALAAERDNDQEVTDG